MDATWLMDLLMLLLLYCTSIMVGRAEYFVFLEEQLLHEYPDEPFVATLPYAQRLADECNSVVVPMELNQVNASA